ncbi:MAG: ATP-binding protein [Kiritimatiellae bacterium]|nr:ATP-binding protein [Kiritimatiellia bacterium]
MVIRSDYLKKIRPFVGLDVVKVATGIRRSGKSVFMRQVRDMIASEIDPNGKFVCVNLEEDENKRFLAKGALHDYVLNEAKKNAPSKIYVFLDEVSEVEEWEKTVNSLRVKENIDLYITGSNSKLLSGELATYLTGRYVEIRVSPFSFREFREARPHEDTSVAFDSYLEFGGMPFLSHIGYMPEPSREYLADLYSSIMMKDIVRRHKVRDVDLLSRVIGYVMSETGHVFSAASILRYLKHEHRSASFDTVMNYLRFGEEAFLFSSAKREDLMGRRILAVDEKFYATDHAMRRAITGGSVRRDIDRTLESVVYREFLRRGYDVRIGRVKEREVDFVCERGNDRLYVQVAYLMESEETREREFSALMAVPDQYPKVVLSLDRVDFSADGIKHKYIPEFLMES